MSCTHNCGCTEQSRDASLDEWPTTAWLQGRAAKETSEDASEAPLEVPASERPANRVPGLPRPIRAALTTNGEGQ